MKIVKIRLTPLFIKSIILTLSINIALSIIYDEELNEFYSLNRILFIGLFISLLGLIFILFCLISRLITYTFYSDKIIKEYNLLFIKKTKIYYFNKRDVIFLKKTNFILSEFYEKRCSLYRNNKEKILSIVLKKDDLHEIENNIFNLNLTKKEHYRRNKSYFKDIKGILNILINTSVYFLIIYLFYTIIISLFNNPSIVFLNRNYNLYLYGFILTLIIFILISTYRILEFGSTLFRIENENMYIKSGILRKINIIIPIESINDFTLKTNVFKKYLNNYLLNLKISKLNKIVLPMHIENIRFLTKLTFENYDTKRKPVLSFVLIIETFIIIISILFSFISIISGIELLFISTLFNLYYLFNTRTLVYENKLIFINSFLLTNYRFISLKDVSEIRKTKIFKSINIISTKIKRYKHYRILNKIDMEQFK